MRLAFKEWAVVVEALGRGEQILILRKGGISEGPGGFRVEQPRFLLFPTRFHQQRESVIESARPWLEQKAGSADQVRIEYLAEVQSCRSLDSLEEAARLRGQHIWREEVIADRFDWGKKKTIFALAVRVYRLGMATELPMLEEYGGCKSWVELANDLETGGATPVLSDAEFSAKLDRFHSALEGGR